MNYIELINNFWKLDEIWQFSCCETRLYFYLLKTANCLGWENSFTHSDVKTSANVGVSKNTLKTSRNRLSQCGLISFKEGGKGHANKTRYHILTPNPYPKVEPNLYPNPYPKVEPLLNKQNKTKQEKEKDKKEKPKRFSPPSLEDVMDFFMSKPELSPIEAEKYANDFYSFYASKNWMIGKNRMSDWKISAGRSMNWENKKKNKEYENQSGITENLARNVAEGIARANTNK